MQQNDPSSISGPLTTPDHRLPAHVRTWVWNGALVVLLILTSIAVASVSAWLVAPYLALMAVILFTPPGRREGGGDRGEESEARSSPGASNANDRPGARNEDKAVAHASADPATVAESGIVSAEVPSPDPDPPAAKARRGKGRGRKAKAVAETPGANATATAIWIQIGPGKFVRAESPGPTVAAASPTSEGEPSGSLPPSPGTVDGPSDAPLLPPLPEAETGSAIAAEGPVEPGGEPETPAVPAPDGEAMATKHDEDHLGNAPWPELTAAAVDAAFESHRDAPAFEGAPTEFVAPLSGTGASSAGTSPFPPGDGGSEAVSTAEESSTPGEGSEAWDGAAPDNLTVMPTATMQAGDHPEHACEPEHAAEPSGVALLGSYPDAPTPLDVEYDPGEREVEVENAAESARDARDQALEEIAGVLVAEEVDAGPTGMEATSDHGPDGVGQGDNGIAPDAPGPILSAVIEDASTRDRGEDANAPDAPSERPNRPSVGTLLASLRGSWPHVGPANATRSRPFARSSGRGDRSARRVRVSSPALRNPSRRGPGRSHLACRTFPPRSPPALAVRSQGQNTRGRPRAHPSGTTGRTPGPSPLLVFSLHPDTGRASCGTAGWVPGRGAGRK